MFTILSSKQFGRKLAKLTAKIHDVSVEILEDGDAAVAGCYVCPYCHNERLRWRDFYLTQLVVLLQLN
jgi:hypothetical protein